METVLIVLVVLAIVLIILSAVDVIMIGPFAIESAASTMPVAAAESNHMTTLLKPM